jgi:glycosyltransferase involved in cell wall biosynthesis
MGTVSQESAMANVYSACDVFLAPSRQENLANTVLEAMACGTPVVAFAVGGMLEAIEHGRTGLLVRPMEDRELADATSTLLSDEALRAGMRIQARKRALALFDVHVQAGKYIDLYREKLGARPS